MNPFTALCIVSNPLGRLFFLSNLVFITISASAQDKIPDTRFPASETPATIFEREWIASVAGSISEDQEEGRSKAVSESGKILAKQGAVYTFSVPSDKKLRKKGAVLFRDSLESKLDGVWQWKMDVNKNDYGKWTFATYMAGIVPQKITMPPDTRYESALFKLETLTKNPDKVDDWINGLLGLKAKMPFPENARGTLLIRYDFPFASAPIRQEVKINKKLSGGSGKQIDYTFSELSDSIVRVYAAFIPPQAPVKQAPVKKKAKKTSSKT